MKSIKKLIDDFRWMDWPTRIFIAVMWSVGVCFSVVCVVGIYRDFIAS